MFSLETLNQLLVALPILSALIIGLTSATKGTGIIPHKWTPVVSVVLGALLGIAFVQLSPIGALVGVISGLASVGMWEVGTKPRE